MNRNSPNPRFPAASLRRDRSPRTVLLRMAADQERADRIRSLKLARPDLTWRRIGDYVGVSERAATDWQKKGGIEYDNAKKLAELFEVDVDYIWRGPSEEERAPSPFAGQDALADRLDAFEALIQKQNELLARQSEILARIEARISNEVQATTVMDESTRRLLAAAEAATQHLRDASARTEEEPSR